MIWWLSWLLRPVSWLMRRVLPDSCPESHLLYVVGQNRRDCIAVVCRDSNIIRLLLPVHLHTSTDGLLILSFLRSTPSTTLPTPGSNGAERGTKPMPSILNYLGRAQRLNDSALRLQLSLVASRISSTDTSSL